MQGGQHRGDLEAEAAEAHPISEVLVLLFGHWMEMRAVGATGYNVIALPLAAGVGVPVGIILAPQWGVLAMAGSAVIVAVNALTLQTLKLGEKM